MKSPAEPKTHAEWQSNASTLMLANATLVLPGRTVRGCLTVEGGMITEIEEGTHVPTGAINCQRDYVLPGLIELHTDNLERHIEPRPAVNWPHLPAILAHDAELASTGITTVFDALRVGSIHNKKRKTKQYARQLANELLEVRSKGFLKISHFLHLRAEVCSETLTEELAKFGTQDRVGIVSLMDHTPGQRQFRDLVKLRTYVTKKRGMTDAEFEQHVIDLKALQAKYGEAHEKAAILEAQRLGATLASHDDTTQGHVQTSHANGVHFAEFPTTVEAAQTCRDLDIAVMMGAPNIIRGRSHSGNVSALELAKTGLLDIISSDYVPSALLLSMFELADLWQDLPRAVSCVTDAPAKATGLKDRGRIEVGKRGDLVRVRRYERTPIIRGVWCQGAQVA